MTKQATGSRVGSLAVAALIAAATTTMGAAGCDASGAAPSFEAVQDQTAVVGQELVINLRATDPDGDAIDFDFDAPQPDIQEGAALTRRPDGTAVFRWTPLAGDVGTWFFDFHAHDADGSDTITVVIDVVSTDGEGSAPIFREPLGSGTTLDLAVAACLDVPVLVEDPDDAEVDLFTANPLEGADMVQLSGVEATWRWCPSKTQLAEDRYPITFAADDGDHDPVLKNFLVVLRSAPKSDCPGEAPHIAHTPQDVETKMDLRIDAEIIDDVGLAREPLLYFTFEEPKLPIDFGSLDVVEMELTSGTMAAGLWTGRIPNPVAAGAEGDSGSVYYLISAKDNDDEDGDCDHLVDAPADGAFKLTVTNGGSMVGAEPCEPCSADVQCGVAADLCTALDGDNVCLSACEDASDCDDGATCAMVNSVDGMSAMQCVPEGGTCSEPPMECEDDAHEDNDSQAAAVALTAGSYNLKSCADEAADDEDWFSITIPEGTATIDLAGTAATNLQLGLHNGAGTAVAQSESATSNESITECLPAGTYFIRVHTFDAGENAYTLSWSHVAGTCGAMVCQDDDQEPDDTQGTATYAEVYPDPYAVADRMICSGDDDYYRIELFTGETVNIDLTFTQTADDEDLDLHFFGPTGIDLTPCSEASPGTCTAAQGQSVTSNEAYAYTVTQAGCAPCNFWVSVHGWDGAQNEYALDIELQP